TTEHTEDTEQEEKESPQKGSERAATGVPPASVAASASSFSVSSVCSVVSLHFAVRDGALQPRDLPGVLGEGGTAPTGTGHGRPAGRRHTGGCVSAGAFPALVTRTPAATINPSSRAHPRTSAGAG